MARNTFTTIFDHANPDHRELKAWRQAGPAGWRTNARTYALRHGEAKVWRSDDSVVRMWNDNGTIRQRTYHHVIHSNL